MQSLVLILEMIQGINQDYLQKIIEGKVEHIDNWMQWIGASKKQEKNLIVYLVE